jgi:integrase
MATIRKRPSGTYEIIIRRKLLPKPISVSADTEAQARALAERIEAQLDLGIIPEDFLTLQPRSFWNVSSWTEEYEKTGKPSASDRPLLKIVRADLRTLALKDINAISIEQWVTAMKARRLTPGSIKKRVGALGRALDLAVHREILSFNPIKNLPKNYAAYTLEDGILIEDGVRDRRLEPGEEEKLRKALAESPALDLLFQLALETAMRMREMFTLTTDQIDLGKRTIFLDKTKNGDKRQVPISSTALAFLTPELKNRNAEALLLPFFDGHLDNTTIRIGYHWRQATKKAGIEDLHFHDLRHEAVCRLFERTSMSDLEIATISGHRDPRMLKRYANLRGSNLAQKMW